MRAMTLPVASKLRLVGGSIAAQTTKKQNAPRPHPAADVEHGLRFDNGFKLLEQGQISVEHCGRVTAYTEGIL
jgi:hypothetical protein